MRITAINTKHILEANRHQLRKQNSGQMMLWAILWKKTAICYLRSFASMKDSTSVSEGNFEDQKASFKVEDTAALLNELHLSAGFVW